MEKKSPVFSSEKILELIKERRSVRSFTGKKIAHEDILSIIESGLWAPTGCNNQELKFLILDKQEEIEEIMEFKPSFRGVSHAILLFCDMSLFMSRKMYVENKSEKHLPYIDAGLALENMILYAKSKGIDSCIFNLSEHHFKKGQPNRNLIEKISSKVKVKAGFYKAVKENFEFYLRKRLKLSESFKILCGVALGYSKKFPNVRSDSHGWNKLMRESVENYIIKRD